MSGLTAHADLEPGDVLLSINNVPVSSVDQASLLTRRGAGKVALLIERYGSRRYVSADPG